MYLWKCDKNNDNNSLLAALNFKKKYEDEDEDEVKDEDEDEDHLQHLNDDLQLFASSLQLI